MKRRGAAGTPRMSRPFILAACGDDGICTQRMRHDHYDSVKMGETPVVAKLRRKDTHAVKLVLNGYQPYETTITRSVSGWVFGNIVFGGLIGLGVDAISGSIYKLSPEKVTGTLTDARTVALAKEDAIHVDVEMKPQPGWELIGQLQRSR